MWLKTYYLYKKFQMVYSVFPATVYRVVIKDIQAGLITELFLWLPNSATATLDSLFAFHMRGGAGGCGMKTEDRFPSESVLTHSLFPPKISKMI